MSGNNRVNPNKKTSKGGNDKKGKEKKSKSRKKSASKKQYTALKMFMDFVFFITIILILGGAFLFMVSQKEDKTIAGYRFYNVLTDSMVKTKSNQKGNFQSGDMIIVKKINPKDVVVGDIITFVPNVNSTNTYLTHRVIEKKEPKDTSKSDVPNFITQGDANNSPDPEISGENIIGKKVLVIPKVGTIIKFVRENLLSVIVFVVSLFLFVYLITSYLKETNKRKRKSRRKKNEKSKKK
ncbi:MAG: signal peptidase I [Vagococcus sp.]|uniref:signal peptidase I n=1 Tax=Vagococcus TaxID=2737 RepID=UPI002FC8820A